MAMSIASFLTAIRDGSPVTVPSPAPAERPEREAVTDIIEMMDFAARTELAFVAPRLVLEVAIWAAERLYHACQFLVYREADADQVRAGCAVSCPAAAAPDVCYSADLIFRYLPDVFALARGIAREDPLIDELRSLARSWPLSSVGVSDLGILDVSAFIEHPGLRRLYADRILERNDPSCLGNAAVAAVVREAIGAFPELAPAISTALSTNATMEASDV